MTSGLQFWDSQVWTFVIEISILLGGMMLANMLRRLIKPLRQSLIPSSVIGGFILLAANFGYTKLTGTPMFQGLTLETITYHCLGLGFIATTLRATDRQKDPNAKRDVFNAGLTTVSGYLLQGVVGLAITLGLSYVLGNWASSGLLLPMGYGQGPGQAYNWGNIYETATAYAPFQGGASFGLTVAAMGFVSASIGGIIYLNVIKRKGRVRGDIVNAEEIEDLSAETITKKGEIPLSESLDKLTVQIGLVFLTYIAAFLVMFLISLGLDALGGFFVNTVKPLIWGFNFLFGTLCAIALKWLLGRGKKRKIIKREYRNNFMLARISGFMFDLMVVASIAAIDLSAFKRREFWIPLTLICVAGFLVTYFQVKYITKKLFPKYNDEMFLAFYGMLTGTASTGVILLREIDPMFETPASSNLVYQQLWAIVFGFPMLLLMGFAPRSTTWAWVTLGLLVLLLIVVSLILFRKQIFKSKKVKES